MDAPQPHALREYALLADGRRGALVDPHGAVVWLCAPSWESPSVFSALHGGRGAYTVAPAGRFTWGGRYETGSLIWRGRWVTEDGIVECRDALARPASAGRVVLLRRVVAVAGTARVRVALEPRAGHDRAAFHVRDAGDGAWDGATGPLGVRWWGAPSARVVAEGGRTRLDAVIDVPEGAHHDLVLVLGDPPAEPPDADRLWRATEDAWRAAAHDQPGAIAPADARHALAVLDGMAHPGGGLVAAATLGLPERARAGRSYDYRYAWIRDGAYAGRAAARAGADGLLDRIVGWTAERVLADGPALMPAYTVDGATVPRERELALPGYPGGRPVEGNRVVDQFQLDGFGECLELFAAAAARGRLDGDGRRAAAAAADAVAHRWTQPDAGIWEIDDRHWTHSRLICAAGLRAFAAAAGTPGRDARRWTGLASAIERDTARTAVHAGRWARSPGDPAVDAALLLPVVRGAVPAADPVAAATIRAIARDLGRDGFVYRFSQGEGPLGEAEGAFLLCGLLMALALHRAGDDVAAARFFERGRGACGPPGLFAEEWDVGQRQLRGNLPQAFVHALLLESAHALSGLDLPGGADARDGEPGGDGGVRQREPAPPA